MSTKNKVAALVAEFLGAGVLTLVFLAVQRSTIGVPYFVGIAAGLAVAMITFVFVLASGAHANPAITLALWTVRKVRTVAAIFYIAAQLLGAWAAYGLYTYFVNNSLQEIGGEYSSRILVAEAVGALIFALGWAVVVFRSNFSLGARAAVLGVSYTLAIIVAASAGLGLVNPAVAFGVRAWELIGSMGWGTYVLGPVLGAVIGLNLYGLLFADSKKVEAVAVEAEVEETVVVEKVPAKPAKAVKAVATKKATAKKTTVKKAPAKASTAKAAVKKAPATKKTTKK